MYRLPDLEGLAVFAKVVELRSFAAAAKELAMSKATVSKSVSRLEARLGVRLFNRTSRRIALTDAGLALAERARRVLAEAEAAENETLAQSQSPRGLVRLSAPMSFGLARVSPCLPEFLKLYPDITIDLHLSDQIIDVIGSGFDVALRIAVLPDSSLVTRRLCDVSRYVVAAPAYFDRHGRPRHPVQLAEHRCLGYAYSTTPDIWHFATATGETASLRPAGPLRVTNGEALLPALTAGLGIAVLPDFIVDAALSSGSLESVLHDWTYPVGGLHLITPPGGPRPLRVELLLKFLVARLSGKR
jgi:DNA-binding transcriptional LysR family regulator